MKLPVMAIKFSLTTALANEVGSTNETLTLVNITWIIYEVKSINVYACTRTTKDTYVLRLRITISHLEIKDI